MEATQLPQLAPAAIIASAPAVDASGAVREPRRRGRRGGRRGGRRTQDHVAHAAVRHGDVLHADGQERTSSINPAPTCMAKGTLAHVDNIAHTVQPKKRRGKRGGLKHSRRAQRAECAPASTGPSDTSAAVDLAALCDMRAAPTVQLDHRVARDWPCAVRVEGLGAGTSGYTLAALLLLGGHVQACGVSTVYVQAHEHWGLARTGTPEGARLLVDRLMMVPAVASQRAVSLHTPRQHTADRGEADTNDIPKASRSAQRWPNAVQLRVWPHYPDAENGGGDHAHDMHNVNEFCATGLAGLSRSCGAQRYAATRRHAIASFASVAVAREFAQRFDGHIVESSAPCTGDDGDSMSAPAMRISCRVLSSGIDAALLDRQLDESLPLAMMPPGTVVVDAASADAAIETLAAASGGTIGVYALASPPRREGAYAAPLAAIVVSGGDSAGTVIVRLSPDVAAAVMKRNRRGNNGRSTHPRSAAAVGGAHLSHGASENKSVDWADMTGQSTVAAAATAKTGKTTMAHSDDPVPIWSDAGTSASVPAMPTALAALLADEGTTKVGFELKRLARDLRRIFGVCCRGLDDIGHTDAVRHVAPAGLSAVAGVFLGVRAGDRELTTSDWHVPTLTYLQVHAAALGAHIARAIYMTVSVMQPADSLAEDDDHASISPVSDAQSQPTDTAPPA